MLATQAISRDMIAASRGDEMAKICRSISEIGPGFLPNRCNNRK